MEERKPGIIPVKKCYKKYAYFSIFYLIVLLTFKCIINFKATDFTGALWQPNLSYELGSLWPQSFGPERVVPQKDNGVKGYHFCA